MIEFSQVAEGTNPIDWLNQQFRQQVHFPQVVCSSDLRVCHEHYVCVQRGHQEPAASPSKVPLLVQSV